MICILNILFNHPVSEATPNSKITGAYWSHYGSPPYLAVAHGWKVEGVSGENVEEAGHIMVSLLTWQ
jgi:hypothetical protein